MNPDHLKQIISNPFYCLRSVSPLFSHDHDPIVSEADWIKAGAKLISDIGPEQYLRLMLDNLKGKYEAKT